MGWEVRKYTPVIRTESQFSGMERGCFVTVWKQAIAALIKVCIIVCRLQMLPLTARTVIDIILLTHVQIMLAACEKVISDLGLGGDFCWVFSTSNN